MNNILIAVGFFFLVLHCVVCAPKTKDEKDLDNDSDEINLRSVIEDIIDVADLEDAVKQAKEKCTNLEQKFNETLDEVHKCSLKVDFGLKTVCSGVMDLVEKCSKPLTDLASECWPVESKGLPLLLEKSLVGIIKQACSSTVEEILELLSPCQTENDWNEVPSCHKVVNASEIYEKELPTTDLVCWVIPDLKQCSKDLQGPSCKNPLTINVASKFFDSIQLETDAVCKKNVA